MDVRQIDPLLFPFLEAEEAAEGEPLLRLFAEHVNPTARLLIARKFSPASAAGQWAGIQDSEEIYHEVQLHLLTRLRKLKAAPDRAPISNLRGYVAAAASNAVDEHLRQRYPRRRSLKDRLRYYLVSEPGLALWEDAEAGWVAGLEAWKTGLKAFPARSDQQAVSDVTARVRAELGQADPQRVRLADLARAIFRAIGSPVAFDDLVTIAARLLQVYDLPPEPVDSPVNLLSSPHTGLPPDPERIAEGHQLIQRLWEEICLLPRRHRVALLLNLRSERGVNVIALLPLTRVATFEQIADALAITVEQLEAIWPNLPMDDLGIASLLGATRQQVINLRKNARARLQKLLKTLEGGAAAAPTGRPRAAKFGEAKAD